MPVITSLLIGTALVSSFQWLVWDGREDEAPPGAPPPSPFSSFANLRRHISRASLRQEREEVEEEEGVELPPETLPGYSRIMERQRSFRVLKKRRAREAENKNPTNPTRITQHQEEDSSTSNEFPRPPKPLPNAKNFPPPTAAASSNPTGTRQPSLTLSDASHSSGTTSTHPPTRTRAHRSSYPLTPEHSQVLLPPVPTPHLQILPAQTINDAQMFDEDEEVSDVVSSWLGSMEREGERVTCGAVNCEANTRKGKGGGVCRCFEEGESEIRGRRMGAC